MKAEKYVDIVAYIISFCFIAAGVLVSLNRFWQYEAFYIDFGQYDQVLWRISRFQEPIMHHFIHGNINVLGDHVTPTVFLLSPLYWFTERSEIILVAQAIVAGVSGLLLYDIAKHVLKDRLLSLSILVSYFLFEGLQNAVITEFHELTIMTLPLMATIWAFVKNKKKLYFLSLILTLGCKETTFPLGIGIGIALFFLRKDWGKISIATILISIAWGLIAFKVILPYFSGDYLYGPSLPGGLLEKAYAFVDQPIKRHTLFFSFFSFALLPFFAPAFWIAILQDYAGRFLTEYSTTRWSLGMHYNAQSAVLLAVSSVYGLSFILKKIRIKKQYLNIIGIIIVLNAVFLFRFVLHGPFLLALNKVFYEHTKDFVFLDTMIAKVPKEAVVMTQNNLATRFTHQEVYLLKVDYKTINPDYILIDNRKGQNANNYFGGSNIEAVLARLNKDKRYTIIYNTGDQKIFKKI